eukprot:3723268-Alexandrium_andersonii.AAC.1
MELASVATYEWHASRVKIHSATTPSWLTAWRSHTCMDTHMQAHLQEPNCATRMYAQQQPNNSIDAHGWAP